MPARSVEHRGACAVGLCDDPGCAPRKLLILSLYGHTMVPRLKTVESHVIVPTSTPSIVARAPKRRSTSTPFPVMADGFDGMEMNVRTPAPFVVRTPVPLFLTVNPPTSSAVPTERSSNSKLSRRSRTAHHTAISASIRAGMICAVIRASTRSLPQPRLPADNSSPGPHRKKRGEQRWIEQSAARC
jgi:hypothetical protein